MPSKLSLERFHGLKEQFLYRPDVDPFAKKISKIALGGLAILAVAARKHHYLSTAATASLALGAAVVIWALPQFLPQTIRFDLLAKHGITEKDIKKYESEAQNNNYTAFETFLSALTTDLIGELKNTHLIPHLLPLLQKGVEADKISEKTLQNLVPGLRSHGIFHLNMKNDIKLIAADGSVCWANKTVLMMAASFFRTSLLSSFREGREQSITLQQLSSQSIENLLLFLYKGQLPESALDSAIELYDFSVMHFIHDLSQCITGCAADQAMQCNDEKKLTQFLSSFRKYSEPESKISLHPDWTASIISKAFTAFFRSQYGFTGSFHLSENRFTIPVNALGLLKQSTLIGKYLKQNVNCVSLRDHLSTSDLLNLTLLKTTLPVELKTKITALEIASSSEGPDEKLKSDIDVVVSMLTKIDTLCLSPSNQRDDDYPEAILFGHDWFLTDLLRSINSLKIAMVFGPYDKFKIQHQYFIFMRDQEKSMFCFESDLKRIFTPVHSFENLNKYTHVSVRSPGRDFANTWASFIQPKIAQPIKSVEISEFDKGFNEYFSVDFN